MENITSIKSALMDEVEPARSQSQKCSAVIENSVVNEGQSPSSAKPPNIVVYSECQSSAACVTDTLSSVLEEQRYTVYILNSSQMLTAPWLNYVRLLVITGDVSPDIASRLKSYVVDGNGRLLCFGSNLFSEFVPALASAKIEDKMAAFTYSKWKCVQMIHRLLKYQPPSTSQATENGLTSITSYIPNEVELPNGENEPVKFEVTTFGQEEDTGTPSFISLTSVTGGGKTLFANVHLEIDQESNHLRREIFVDLLSKHFGLLCSDEPSREPVYTFGYLFGEAWRKKRLLAGLEGRLNGDGVLRLKKIDVRFCGSGCGVPEPSATLLPVFVESQGQCEHFSSDMFFSELKTRSLGRVVLFSEVMTSSMYVIDTRLVHGLMVVPRSLTRGVGRGDNVWLSPPGCALFSLQLQLGADSRFTGRLGLLQHCVTLAAVSAVRGLPGLAGLDVRLKWPNDIYAHGTMKIGGAIASCNVSSRDAICNLGVGVNLFNRRPTTCLNDMIDALNERNVTGTVVQRLTLERFVAIMLNQLEQLMDMVENGRIDDVIQLYYKYWLHSGSKVLVRTEDGSERRVTILGIDQSGFLRVEDQEQKREFSVHPDGNSFDMMAGLIAPKVF